MLVNQGRALRLLKKYGLRAPRAVVLDRPEVPKGFSFPVAVKLDSPNIIHKTEEHAVRIGIGKDELVAVMQEMARPDARFVVQEMVEGVELLMGMKRDPTFGPVIVLGVGGVYVEVFKDSVMRVAPLTKRDARAMVEGLRSQELLDGFRGLPIVDRDALADALVRLSRLAMAEGSITEIDCNPVIAGKRVLVVDARFLEGS